MTDKPVDIVIAGAGSIGCFLGGALALAGRRIALLARQRIQDEIAEHGLTVSDFSGMSETIAADDLVGLEAPDFPPPTIPRFSEQHRQFSSRLRAPRPPRLVDSSTSTGEKTQQS